MKSGIYKITNIENGKVYIGKAMDIPKRFIAHLDNLRASNHTNKGLQNDFNVYGENALRFEVLEYTDQLDRRESVYCHENSVWDSNKGYNSGRLKDYRVIDFEDSLKLGERIIRNIFNKNTHLFSPEEKELAIPISVIAANYELDTDVVYIALSESIYYTDIRDTFGDWSVHIEKSYYLRFFNADFIGSTAKNVPFFQ